MLQILRRQVVETAPDGKPVPQQRWIKYGSRVLLSLLEQTAEARQANLNAIFSDREKAVAAVGAAGSDAERDRARRALQAHDYVYDVFAAPEPVSI